VLEGQGDCAAGAGLAGYLYLHRWVRELGSDGGLFVLGACCGAAAADALPQSRFDFTVMRGPQAGSAFRVQRLPVYVPDQAKPAPSLVSANQRPMFEQALQNQPAVAAAAISVENMSGPLLCISDTRDQVWPSTLMCNQIMDWLDQNGFPLYREHISYDESHYTCRPETCLARVIAFLKEHFK
jgi:hypothetical protein